jgi:predicted MFS family arabinose efflux permease
VFAKLIFKGNAQTFGYIYSFFGLGALSGTVFLASLKTGTDLKIVLLINTIILGLGLIFFSHTSYFPLAMFFAVLSGFGAMAQSTISITIIQVTVDSRMRGRVISYLAMAMFGMLPLGSLLVGFISQRIGVVSTMMAQGIIALIIAASFSNFLRRDKLTLRKNGSTNNTENLIWEKI